MEEVAEMLPQPNIQYGGLERGPLLNVVSLHTHFNILTEVVL